VGSIFVRHKENPTNARVCRDELIKLAERHLVAVAEDLEKCRLVGGKAILGGLTEFVE
jgi:hypothetical protein